METRHEIRIKKLMRLLKKNNCIHLKEAAQLLKVSEMTLRRDLSDGSTLMALLGGFIVLDPKVSPMSHYFISEEKNRNLIPKQHIGQLAAAQINENDTVFFDCGTTSPLIVEHIPDECHFTAVCCSLNLFLALQNKSHCQVILCGGKFNADIHTFVPLDNVNEFQHIRPNKAFISAAGISLTHGLTCFTFDEIRIKRQILAHALQKILIVDNSKWGRTQAAHFGELQDIDSVITDSPPPSEFQYFLNHHHIKINY